MRQKTVRKLINAIGNKTNILLVLGKFVMVDFTEKLSGLRTIPVDYFLGRKGKTINDRSWSGQII